MNNESDPQVTNEETTVTNSENTSEATSAESTAVPENSNDGQQEVGNATVADSNVSQAVPSSSETGNAQQGGAESVAQDPSDSVADRPSKPKLQIGSQRDVAARPAQPKAVEQAKANPVDLGNNPVEDVVIQTPEIKSTAGLGDDLEAEIAAALGGVSMDQVVNEIPESSQELELNSRVKCTVTRLHGDNAFANVRGQFEGVIPLAQFKKQPTEGTMIEVIVKGRNSDDGLYELAIPGSSVAVADWSDLTEGTVLEARISGSNTGGLEAMVNNIRAFIPASQIDRVRVENFGDYVGQKLQCVVTEVKPAKKRLVLSRRAILDREFEAKRAERMETLEIGEVYEGKVTKLMDFGAFVDIGGVEGLVHVSKLSWDRVSHPKEVLKVGEGVKVKLEKIDASNGKLSLSYRDTTEHPWHNIGEKFEVNDTVTGTVTRIAQFGAFVKIGPGIEGLVHISEIAHHRVLAVKNHLKNGDEVSVKILSLDPDSQKIGLSIKATQEAPVKPEKKEEEDNDEPVRELAVKKRNEPLKGGMNRKTGGEDFGLNW